MEKFLKFNRPRYEEILRGTKIGTSRKGYRDIHLGELDAIMTEDETQKCKINVVRVTHCVLGNIGRNEAVIEGYKDERDMISSLKKIYGTEISNNTEFTFVQWDAVNY
jgi:hypothetical protein